MILGSLGKTPGFWMALALLCGPGCATMRTMVPHRDLQPCTDGYALTEDGWKLGIRHYRPANPDPSKLPVVLAHGLGLNGTFWTITHHHLPEQLTSQGYNVFVVDMRGSGASHRVGAVGAINRHFFRQTFLRELGSRDWNVDDEAFYDVPAILEYVTRETGKPKVNWIGHSLGGMFMFPFLEHSPHRHKVASFVAMGSPACVVPTTYRTKMLNANRNLRKLLYAISTGRIARPMALFRPPGLEAIDRLYYTAENVDRRTIDCFYGFTLEDPGPGALAQLDHYLDGGTLVSADRELDYYRDLPRVSTPTLFIAGEGDIMADIPSTQLTFNGLGSADKTLLRFGRAFGHHADYGHCDLVWSRYAPQEIFPRVIEWLDQRQVGPSPLPVASGQQLPVVQANP